jgi:hypothetical protein
MTAPQEAGNLTEFFSLRSREHNRTSELPGNSGSFFGA